MPDRAAPDISDSGAKRLIVAQARALGFDSVGVAPPEATLEPGRRMAALLAQGWHGDMDWLVPKMARRADPTVLWPEVRSIIMLGINYGPATDPLENIGRAERGNVSVYARGRDYHDVVKSKLKQLGQWLHREFSAGIKVFVDTAPVMEKPLAAAAGLGWQGKHTNLVSREFGSWLFLGAIYTTLALPADQPSEDHCGSCQSCISACPTAAIIAPYRLEAKRCISYLTIEHRGSIPKEFRRQIGNRIYGCDDCLAVCPWNKYASVAGEIRLLARSELSAATLVEFSRLDDKAFRAKFAGTAVKRLGRDRFVRNVAIAMGNACAADNRFAAIMRPELERLCADAAPMVRAMAIWSMSFILDEAEFKSLAGTMAQAETDPLVLAELSPPASGS